jgi:protein-tyrosine-phosphatase
MTEVGVAAVGHRSRQISRHDLEADVIVALAREHVGWIRREHPEAANKTATLRRLCRDLPHEPGPLVTRIAGLHLEDVELEPWEDVDDPAGGDVDVFVACARDLIHLVNELAPRLDIR